MTDAFFSGILSVSQGLRLKAPPFFVHSVFSGRTFYGNHEGHHPEPAAAALGLFASSASGSKVVKGGIKGVLPVLVIMTVLSLAARLAGYGSVLGGLVGIFIIVMLPIGILTSYVLWKKGKIQVVDKEQK